MRVDVAQRICAVSLEWVEWDWYSMSQVRTRVWLNSRVARVDTAQSILEAMERILVFVAQGIHFRGTVEKFEWVWHRVSGKILVHLSKCGTGYMCICGGTRRVERS